ncbi:MAG: glycosyl transferase [Rhodobacteraceae bacterium]|nr:glycosyl transferase [Paracoccaceae bacterium]
MLNLDEIWRSHTEALGVHASRPDFRFDEDFYKLHYPELAKEDVAIDCATHFELHGKKEGRVPNAYQKIRAERPQIDKVILGLLTDEDLKDAVEKGQKDAAQLAYELMALPHSIDEKISDFSALHYTTQYPDVKDSGILPLYHFLLFGKREQRSSLRTLRRNFYQGDKPFDESKKTILLTVHEFTTTGAPLVGLELVKQAAQTHNVVVLSLQVGPLLERFRRECNCVFVTLMPHEEIDFVLRDVLSRVDYALCNSSDSSPFIRMMVSRGIPFGFYIHEYTQYSLPLHKTIHPCFYADFAIFSSENVRESWRGIMEDSGFDLDSCSTIIPQAQLKPGRVARKRYQDARDRIGRILGIDLGNRRLVYGAGSTHWRKGTDLFIMMAQIAHERDPEAVFVWIGDGMNHEDFHCGVWLEKQMVEAHVNEKGGYFHYVPGGDYYNDLVIASDALFLSSRMDPLPNVVLDAVKFDSDVILFENASGYDDETYKSQPRFHRVGYGRVDEAAKLATTLPRKSENLKRLDLSREDTDVLGDDQLFKRISTAFEAHLAKRRHFYLGEGEYDLPILFSERDDDKDYRVAERQKAWSLGRKTVWKSEAEARQVLQASDHPVHKSGVLIRYKEDLPQDLPDFSIHVHAYYTDDLYHDASSYGVYQRANNVVITTDQVKKANLIHKTMKDLDIKAEIVQVANQGRDILPFMQLFNDIETYGNDDIWAHVHQKKSFSSTPGGDTWRNFLLKILFGDKEKISNALLQMTDPEVGLVTPFDPYICGWFGSKRILPIYQKLVETPFPDHPILFPVGNMFWTRRAVVNQMNSYFGADYPWPNEPIANDGTVFHMIERLWPTAAYDSGHKSIFVSKPDQPRR